MWTRLEMRACNRNSLHVAYIGILAAVLLVLAHFGRKYAIIDAWNLFGCEADYIHVGLKRPVDLKVMKVTARRSEDDDTFVG